MIFSSISSVWSVGSIASLRPLGQLRHWVIGSVGRGVVESVGPFRLVRLSRPFRLSRLFRLSGVFSYFGSFGVFGLKGSWVSPTGSLFLASRKVSSSLKYSTAKKRRPSCSKVRGDTKLWRGRLLCSFIRGSSERSEALRGKAFSPSINPLDTQ